MTLLQTILRIAPALIALLITVLILDLFLSYYILDHMISIIPGWHTTIYDIDQGWRPGFQTLLIFLFVGGILSIYTVIKYLIRKVIVFLQSKSHHSQTGNG